MTTPTTPEGTETDAVAELAIAAAAILEPVDGLHIGHQTRLATLDLETHLDSPRRARAAIAVDTPEALNVIVNRWHSSGADDVNVYCSTVPAGPIRQIVAVLNDHSRDTPGHRDLRVNHQPRLAEPWKVWSEHLGTALTQRQFAELIEDRLDTIAEPAAADLLDVVTTFSTTTTIRFASAVNLQNGLRRLTYSEDDGGAESGSAGNLTVPDRITLVVPIYNTEVDVDEQVTIGIRYSVAGGELKIMLRLIDAAATYRTANDHYLEQLDADFTVVAGTP